MRAVAAVLRPGGRYFGVLWDTGREGGPPYRVTPADVGTHFGGAFEIEALEPVPAWTTARWDELAVALRLRATARRSDPR